MRTRRIRGRLLRRRRSRGGIVEGRHGPRRISPGVDARYGADGDGAAGLRDGRRRRCVRWCIWRARSGRMEASRRTSGSTGRRTGQGFSWMRLRFRSFWRGGCGSRMGWGSFDIFPFVERAAAFLVKYAPVTQQERWEETAGYSPSTLAAVISALVCAADIARARHGRWSWRAIWRLMPTGLNRTWMSGRRRTEGSAASGGEVSLCADRPPAAGEPFYNPSAAGRVGSRSANREPGRENVTSRRERWSTRDFWSWCGMGFGGRTIR